MVTAEMSWGQIQQWTWINDMRRDPSRWVVVGDVLELGAESKMALESALRDLVAEYELDLWVIAGVSAGEPRLRRSRFDVPVEWTNLQGSRVWAVHVIHSRFRLGHYEIDAHAKPIRLFGYTREDGRFSVIAAISHLFADGTGLKGFARVLSDRLAGRQGQVPVVALSNVLLSQRAARRRQHAQVAIASDRFETYYKSFDWDRLAVRETGEFIFRLDKGDIIGDTRSMTVAGTVVAALGSAWRQCIEAVTVSNVPLTLLHRLRSPLAGRPYMGPGDLNVLLAAPSPGADISEEGANIWRSLIAQSRKLETDPPPQFSTTGWTIEQNRFRRTLRLNVRANAFELAREPGVDRFAVHSSRSEPGARAFADVAFTRQAFTMKWDIPRAVVAQGRDETFGQLTLARLLTISQAEIA
jgi:hypothetical protein